MAGHRYGRPAVDVAIRTAGEVDERGARRSARRRRWHRARTASSVLLLAAAVTLVVTRGGSLLHSADRISRVRPEWVVVAIGAESLSMVVYGRLQQRLLRAAGSLLPFPTMAAITTAANAVTGTLPGGVGWAAAWLYDQLGSRGVTRFARVWMFLVAGGVSSFALFCLLAAGVEIAGSRGPVASLRWLALLLALIPAAALGVDAFGTRGPVRRLVRWGEGLADRPGKTHGARRAPLGTAARALRSVVREFTAVKLGTLGWAHVLGLALLNWLFDCVVVVAACEGLGVHAPWRGVLVIYGLTQISASIPVTPGGIGVVEGSMIALMHAYGVAVGAALPVVFLYRILSYWILVPVGWGIWSLLELRSRAWRLRRGQRDGGQRDGGQPAGTPAGLGPAGAGRAGRVTVPVWAWAPLRPRAATEEAASKGTVAGAGRPEPGPGSARFLRGPDASPPEQG